MGGIWIALTLVLLGFIGCGPTRQQQQRDVQSEMVAYKQQEVGAAFWIEAKPDEMPAIEPSNFADVAERLKPAVVNLSGITQVYAEGRGSEAHRTSLGSGFIINKDGYIVTNNNVIEKATDIKVLLLGQGEFDAKLLGRDPKADLALLKIDATRDLPVVPLGDSDRLRVNEPVIAISSTPFGQGHTVMPGIVSAKEPLIGGAYYEYDFIQTDAIKPGSGGGALFNLKGQVMGINTAIIRGRDIGVAISINMAKEVLPQLRAKGRVPYGWLGVAVQPVTSELAREFGLVSERGALVARVLPNSPAQRAGLQLGDVIVEFNDRLIGGVNELLRLIPRTPPGRIVTIKVIRNGGERVMRSTIGDSEEAPPSELKERPRAY